jgi:hypothetical protein
LRPRYAIICPRCVALGREQTVHLMRSHRARWCPEHARSAASMHYATKHPLMKSLIMKRYYARHIERHRAAKRADYRKRGREILELQKQRRDLDREPWRALAKAWRLKVKARRDAAWSAPDPHYTKLALI